MAMMNISSANIFLRNVPVYFNTDQHLTGLVSVLLKHAPAAAAGTAMTCAMETIRT